MIIVKKQNNEVQFDAIFSHKTFVISAVNNDLGLIYPKKIITTIQ